MGEEVARVLAEHFGTISNIRRATKSEVAGIHGLGDTVAESVTAWFADNANRTMLDRLLGHLAIAPVAKKKTGGTLAGKTFVLTGTLERMTRDEAKQMIRDHGGKIVESVSKKTDYVIAGVDPGSKLDTAQKIGVKVLSETEFVRLLK